MTRVLAVDPGGVTGLAVWDDCTESEFFVTWAQDSAWRAVDQVRDEVVEGLDALVVEDYRITGARAREANQTIEIIGALAWICHKRGVPFVRQEPGEGQRFAGRRWEKLRRLGWYVPGPDHERSAAAHLLLYLVRAGFVSPSRVVQCET